jgi:hypothetical protein
MMNGFTQGTAGRWHDRQRSLAHWHGAGCRELVHVDYRRYPSGAVSRDCWLSRARRNAPAAIGSMPRVRARPL